MSFLIGPVSGALVAGGVYYGFSNMVQTRTTTLRRDLHILADRLQDTPPTAAPLSASDRIARRPFTTLFKSRWNQQVELIFKHVGDWDRHALAWGRRLLYGTRSTDGSTNRRE